MYDPDDPRFRSVLDHGFVYLVDKLGDDSAIAAGARISYGAGTKSVREDRGLIRYLMRHHHSSPYELCVVKFHLRIPIFVARQLFRHRTSSLNEYSARYSIVPDQFYIPDAEAIKPQSADNRQGRDGDVSDTSKAGVQWMIESVCTMAYDVYRILLGERKGCDTDFPDDLLYDPYSHDNPLFDDEFPGVAREIARTVLPVAFYTECYWQQNLHNLFHLLKLRTDPHTQHETRLVANAMYELIEPHFPTACEAWRDYSRDAVTLSRMEVQLMRDLLDNGVKLEEVDPAQYGMTKRELREFNERFGSTK